MYAYAKTVFADNCGLLLAGCGAFAALWSCLLSHHRADLVSSGVVTWWTLLCGVGVVNVCGWHRSAVAVVRRRPKVGPSVRTFQRRQLVLSALFVLGCSFRSILPRADVQRIGLVDSWASSVLVGRSVATVAELCFVAQWALLLNCVAKEAGSRLALGIAWILVPLIAIAEACSWYAVLTTCYAGNAIEESIWALSALLMMGGCLASLTRYRVVCRPLLVVALVLGAMYVTFMCTVDIPMYVSRWRADAASGREYLSLGQGLHDAWSRRVVTFDWREWRTEIPWMSLYFSLAVWCSLAVVHASPLELRRRINSRDMQTHSN